MEQVKESGAGKYVEGVTLVERVETLYMGNAIMSNITKHSASN